MKPSTPDRIRAAMVWLPKRAPAITALRSVPRGDWAEIRSLMLQEAADADDPHAAWLSHTATLLADPQDYLSLLAVMEPQELLRELRSLRNFIARR